MDKKGIEYKLVTDENLTLLQENNIDAVCRHRWKDL